MATLLNWDALGDCEYIDVKSQRLNINWHLRDDVDGPVVMRYIAFMAKVAAWQKAMSQMQADLQDREDASQEEIEDLAAQAEDFQTFDHDLTGIVLALVRHTYPEVDEATVAKLTYNQRRDLAQAFLSRTGGESKPPANATSVNRATRRAATSRR